MVDIGQRENEGNVISLSWALGALEESGWTSMQWRVIAYDQILTALKQADYGQ